jgi:hypothetical protein
MALDYSRSRQASIAIEIDPVDATGSATKKRGYTFNLRFGLN